MRAIFTSFTPARMLRFAHYGMLGQALCDHAQRFGPCWNVHVVSPEAVDPLPVTVAQIQKPRTNIQRSVILLKLLMLELKDRFRILNTLKQVVRREAREHLRRARPIDLATVRQLSCDGSSYGARISLRQRHGAAAGHLRCEGLEIVRLLAEDRCRL